MKEALTLVAGAVLGLFLLAFGLILSALPYAVALLIAVWMLRACA